VVDIGSFIIEKAATSFSWPSLRTKVYVAISNLLHDCIARLKAVEVGNTSIVPIATWRWLGFCFMVI